MTQAYGFPLNWPGVVALTLWASLAGAAGAQQPLPAVEAVPAAHAVIEKHVPMSGSLVARQEVVLYPKVAGYAVTRLLADTGDRIEAGQVLATLQDDTLRALVAQAEAEHQRAAAGVKQAESQISSMTAALTESSSSLARARQLRAGGNIAQAALDQAVAAQAAAEANAASAQDGLAVARAALALADAARVIARLDLENSKITSPVSGLVTARNASLGDLSGNAAQPMFRIIADGKVEFAAEVSQSGLPDLAVGAPVALSVAGLGQMTGQIRLLPASVDPQTRLGEVRVSLPETQGLRVGLFASGHVVAQSGLALTVPTTAVLNDGGADYVQLVIDGHIQARQVEAGLIWDGRREIITGLDEGEVVLTRAGAFFSDGDAVRVVAHAPVAPDAKAGP